MKAGISFGVGAIVLAMAAPASAQGACDRTFKVSWEPWPPYQIDQGDGPPTGIDMEMVKAVAEEVGCDVKFVELPWKRQLRQIKKGKIDLTPAANYTEKRDEFAHYSEPYLDFESILWVNAGDSEGYNSLKDFLDGGKRLGVTQGWTYGDTADKLIDMGEYQKQIDKNSKVKLNIRMTAAGRVDGTLGNRYTIAYQAKEQGVRENIRRTNAVVQSAPVHIIFSEKSVSKETVETWSDAIKKLKKNGTIEEITKEFAG